MASAKGFDAIIAETDPFLLGIVASQAAKRLRARFVAYLQDIYPDIAVRLGKIREGIVTQSIRRRLKTSYRMADAVIVLSEQIRDHLIGWGIESSKLQVVPNWTDCNVVKPVSDTRSFRLKH